MLISASACCYKYQLVDGWIALPERKHGVSYINYWICELVFL